MRESVIEARFVAAVKSRGGRADKFVSPSGRARADRVVWLPKGRVFLVECKATGEKLEPHQERERDYMRGLGFDFSVIDRIEQIESWFEERGL